MSSRLWCLVVVYALGHPTEALRFSSWIRSERRTRELRGERRRYAKCPQVINNFYILVNLVEKSSSPVARNDNYDQSQVRPRFRSIRIKLSASKSSWAVVIRYAGSIMCGLWEWTFILLTCQALLQVFQLSLISSCYVSIPSQYYFPHLLCNVYHTTSSDLFIP